MNSIRAAIAAITVTTLTACGGGGGDDAAPAQPAPPTSTIPMPEGLFGGTTTAPSEFQMLVLEDGGFWAVYGTQAGPAGFVQGTITGTPAVMLAADAKDFGASPATPANVRDLTYSNLANGGYSLGGSLTSFGQRVVFNGESFQSLAYDYSQPASLSAISGGWALQTTLGEDVLLSILPSGAISARGAGSGCTMAGNVQPRASGKNVFNVSLTFGPAPCALPGQSAHGVVIAYPLNGNRTQMVVTLVDASRSFGVAAGGVR